MIEVVVSRLGRDSGTRDLYVVILRERDGDRILPIWIGRAEAESIHAHIEGIQRERPMTHDLAHAIVSALGGVLEAVHITRVHDSTFFAELHLRSGTELHVVDARPSDSIAIALRMNAPIFAAEELLSDFESGDGSPTESPEGEGTPESEEQGIQFGAAAPDLSESSLEAHLRNVDQLKRYLERLRPEDFGKFRP